MQVGIDVVEVDRIKKNMGNPKFLERILTPQEIEVCNYSPQRIAGRWAAKEAIYKVCSEELDPFNWQHIEILNHKNGKPYVQFTKDDLSIKCGKIEISISHEKSVAVAVAIRF